MDVLKLGIALRAVSLGFLLTLFAIMLWRFSSKWGEDCNIYLLVWCVVWAIVQICSSAVNLALAFGQYVTYRGITTALLPLITHLTTVKTVIFAINVAWLCFGTWPVLIEPECDREVQVWGYCLWWVTFGIFILPIVLVILCIPCLIFISPPPDDELEHESVPEDTWMQFEFVKFREARDRVFDIWDFRRKDIEGIKDTNDNFSRLMYSPDMSQPTALEWPTAEDNICASAERSCSENQERPGAMVEEDSECNPPPHSSKSAVELPLCVVLDVEAFQNAKRDPPHSHQRYAHDYLPSPFSELMGEWPATARPHSPPRDLAAAASPASRNRSHRHLHRLEENSSFTHDAHPLRIPAVLIPEILETHPAWHVFVSRVLPSLPTGARNIPLSSQFSSSIPTDFRIRRAFSLDPATRRRSRKETRLSLAALKLEKLLTSLDAARKGHVDEEEEFVCAICFCEFEDDDDVVILPCDGHHFYHPACVKSWFERSALCPTCRADVVAICEKKKENQEESQEEQRETRSS